MTCGLCPGLNDAVRSIVLSLYHHYGVTKVYGFRFGYEGLVRRIGHPPLRLTPDSGSRIHETGGSVLGSSRGPQEMAATLQDLKVGILFTIGRDGTLRGAQKIAEAVWITRGCAASILPKPSWDTALQPTDFSGTLSSALNFPESLDFVNRTMAMMAPALTVHVLHDSPVDHQCAICRVCVANL